jgi:hypothetical protein
MTTDSQIDASKTFENISMTTDPTTGNIIIINTVNHVNLSTKLSANSNIKLKF